MLAPTKHKFDFELAGMMAAPFASTFMKEIT
jgi:hypothetical protein